MKTSSLKQKHWMETKTKVIKVKLSDRAREIIIVMYNRREKRLRRGDGNQGKEHCWKKENNTEEDYGKNSQIRQGKDKTCR